MNAGLEEERIVIIPHGVDLSVFKPKEKPRNEKCTFLWNKGWSKGINDRSGFHSVLQAFCEEFKHEEAVKLVAHVNPAYNLPGWNIEEEFAKLNLPSKEVRAEINVNADVLPLTALPGFYEKGDFFIGTSKADAFNIPVLEAMACGLPIITSNFSGAVDYVPESCWFVSGKLVPASVTDINEVAMYEQSNWLELDVGQLRFMMRTVFDLWKDHPEHLREVSNECIEASKKWTWEKSANLLISTILELEGNNAK